MTQMLSHEKIIDGSACRIGDTIISHLPDGTDIENTIDHFSPYPGTFVGDGARRAFFDVAEERGCTIADHEHVHIRCA